VTCAEEAEKSEGMDGKSMCETKEIEMEKSRSSPLSATPMAASVDQHDG
jgi:hypothetical protein